MSTVLALTLTLWLLFGLAGGICHFALLRWNASLYVSGAGLLGALAVQLLRMAATAAVLGFAAWHGAVPLLVSAIGVLLGRTLVLRVTAVTP